MSERLMNEYRPDIVTCPGETLLEILEDRGMSQAELAERMGRPKKTINEIVNGKAEITSETAIQLERVLGVPASIWSNLERHYRESLARTAERQRLREYSDWPERFPLRQMAKFDWLELQGDRTDQIQALLSFFAVSSIEQWELRYGGHIASFRMPKKFQPDLYALTAWLRQGERMAQDIHCTPFNLENFRAALKQARTLTRETSPAVFVKGLRDLGARCGVAIVFVPELEGSRACGATRWLNPLKALVQLSLRYKSNDQLWFTFFHEAGHIVLHGKREVFLEVDGGLGPKEQEAEADGFAGDHLIPRHSLEEFIRMQPISRESIVVFAKSIGIAPGIVVGRLQHDEHVPFSHFNGLKVRYSWTHEAD